MNRLFSVLILCSFLFGQAFAQGVGINSTGASPDPSAILDISSSDKGMLVPRMTEAQRDAISNPAAGLQVFNTDSDCFNIYTAGTWKQVCPECSFSLPLVQNNSPICEGDTLDLTATTTPGATYSWTGPNGFSSSDQNPVILNATSAASGTYSLQVTVSGCTSSAITTTVTVNPSPQTPTASNDGPACEGSSINLSASNVVGAVYDWTGPNAYSAGGQAQVLSNVTVSFSGTYSVIATVNGCSSAAGTTNVSVLATPATPGSISGPTSVSGGSSNSYSISAVAGASTYTWSVPSGWSINSGQGTTSVNVTAGSAGGQLSVTAGNICGTSGSATLNVGIPYTWSEVMTGGSTNSAQCNTWTTYTNALVPSAYSKVTLKGSNDPVGVTCTDPTTVQSMATALKNQSVLQGLSCDGNSWEVHNYVGHAIGANASTGSCSTGSNVYIVRPCINNTNWGGIAGATCGAGTQTMTVVFE